MSNSPDKPYSPAIKTLFIIVVLSLSAWQMTKSMNLAWNAWGVDYTKHYLAEIKILNGECPYKGELPDAYPAFTKLLFLWLAPFDRYTGEVVWDVWNLFMIFAAAIIAGIFYRPREPATQNREKPTAVDAIKELLHDGWWAWGVFLVCLFLPAVKILHSGNISATHFFFLVAWGAFYIKDRPFASGVFLVLTALVKVFTIIVIFPFIVARKWKTLGGAAAAMALYLLGVTIAGWWSWEIYLYRERLPGLPFVFQPISYGINNLIIALFAPGLGESDGAFRVLSSLVGLFFLAISCAALWIGRRQLKQSEGMDRALTFFFVLLPLMTPLLEYHHYTWCVPAWLLLWRSWINGALSNRFFTAQFFLWAIIIGGGYVGDLSSTGYWTALAGVFALWVLNGIMLVRKR